VRAIVIVAFVSAILCVSSAPSRATTRTFYIAADEVMWNYAPSGKDLIAGKTLAPVQPPQLGWIYWKAIYREYTDGSFRTLKPRRASDAYLGFLGPVIRAEVGDTIVVKFKNNTRLHLSVHAHGMLYDKASEGAPYQDGSSRQDKAGNAVPRGGLHTYVWHVPERSGPGPGDASSIVWMYHSHTDEVRDVNTGPIGPIIVTARGMAKPDGSPKDVDAEFVTAFSEMDEGQSRLLSVNLASHVTNRHHLTASSPGLLFSNQIFSINGYVFGNMPMISMKKGERVRWYVFATMSDFDFHSPDWHGETVLMNGRRVGVLQLGPMDMRVVDMIPDNPGTWLLNCDVNVHLDAGMEAQYKVLK
jgi:FtsP/CotA-like multicopper oxidase with cupredoxin domain